MKVLVVNAGSSSCKYQLIEMDSNKVLCSGLAERIGLEMGKLTHKIDPDGPKEEKIVREQPFPTHKEAIELVIALLTDPEKGVIKSKSEIFAIGHRVLHGGETMTEPVLVDEHVKKVIEDCFPLGPLHNPPNLTGIKTCEALFEGIPNVAVFDTEFGMGMPEESY
nr:acetate kinase [Desulfovibrio sp.]